MKRKFFFNHINKKKFSNTVIIISVVIIVFVFGGYFLFKKNQDTSISETSMLSIEVFPTQQECEQKTGKLCDFQMCDYIPPSKTSEEVCGRDFKKGWIVSQTQAATPNQEIRAGEDIKIVGTVIGNITELASIDGPAYLNILSDDGMQIRVTYSRGEAECRNTGISTYGFSVETGTRVEVYAKAISKRELFICDSNSYYIKPLTMSDN